MTVSALLQDPRGFQMLNTDFCREEMSTPLHIAARIPSPELFEILINAGADPSLRDIHGRTPLHILAAPERRTSGNIRILEALVKKGWSLDDPDKQGQTCLDALQVSHMFLNLNPIRWSLY